MLSKCRSHCIDFDADYGFQIRNMKVEQFMCKSLFPFGGSNSNLIKIRVLFFASNIFVSSFRTCVNRLYFVFGKCKSYYQSYYKNLTN